MAVSSSNCLKRRTEIDSTYGARLHFYSIPLVRYVMYCSDNNKSSRTLHREILSAFSPSVVAIDNSDYGSPVNSYKFKILFSFMRTIIFRYPILKRIARQIINYKNDLSFDCKILRCISEQVGSCEYLQQIFLSRETRRDNKESD